MPDPREHTIEYNDEPNPRGVIKHVILLVEINGYNTPYYVRGIYTSKYRARRAAYFFYRYLPEYKEDWTEVGTRTSVNKSLPYLELHMVKCELDKTYTKQLNTVKEALKNAHKSSTVHEGDQQVSAASNDGTSDAIEEGA